MDPPRNLREIITEMRNRLRRGKQISPVGPGNQCARSFGLLPPLTLRETMSDMRWKLRRGVGHTIFPVGRGNECARAFGLLPPLIYPPIHIVPDPPAVVLNPPVVPEVLDAGANHPEVLDAGVSPPEVLEAGSIAPAAVMGSPPVVEFDAGSTSLDALTADKKNKKKKKQIPLLPASADEEKASSNDEDEDEDEEVVEEEMTASQVPAREGGGGEEKEDSPVGLDPGLMAPAVDKKKNKKNRKKKKKQIPQWPASAVDDEEKDSEEQDEVEEEEREEKAALHALPAREDGLSNPGHQQIDFFYTKDISFLGQQYRVVLQPENGPWTLIIISNYLILSGNITLPKLATVDKTVLTELVFSAVFPKMKDEGYEEVKLALLATGQDIDIRCTTHDEFVETPQQRIFKTLKIPLYHTWVLNLDHEDDWAIMEVTGERSYNTLNTKFVEYKSAKGAADRLPPEATEAACTPLNKNDDIIYRFMNDSAGQTTKHGISTLGKMVPDGLLFILFINSQLNITYKDDGVFFTLHTDDSFLDTRNVWQCYENLSQAPGVFVEDVFKSRNEGLNVSKAGTDLEAAKVFGHQRHKKYPHQDMKPQPQGSKSIKMAVPSATGSKSRKSSQMRTRPISPHGVKAKFGSWYSSDDDEIWEQNFLNFLRGFKVNNTPYYAAYLHTMKILGSSEMLVHFDHIYSFDGKVAEYLCRCYPSPRVQSSLNNAARTFINEQNIHGFHFEDAVVYISGMPKNYSWIPFTEFLNLRGYHLSELRNIEYGDYSLRIPDTTMIGRIILTNFLIMMTRTHADGCSWNGLWTLEDVRVNDFLEVTIIVPAKMSATPQSEANDFLKFATDLLSKYEIDGLQPGYFRHLNNDARRYITLPQYSAEMARKFRDFITVHPFLKSSLTRLGIVDDVFSAYRALNGSAKSLLQCIVNSRPLQADWRICLAPAYSHRLPPCHSDTYQHHKNLLLERKQKESGGSDKDGIVPIEEPFSLTALDSLSFQRHVCYHGSDKLVHGDGIQKMQKLSDLELLNAHQFGNVLPTIVKGLIYYDYDHSKFSQEVVDKVWKWIDEILVQYERREFPESSGYECLTEPANRSYDFSFPRLGGPGSAPPVGHDDDLICPSDITRLEQPSRFVRRLSPPGGSTNPDQPSSSRAPFGDLE